MHLSWFITWEFVKALLICMGVVLVLGSVAIVVVCWVLTRNADDLNRHSSYR